VPYVVRRGPTCRVLSIPHAAEQPERLALGDPRTWVRVVDHRSRRLAGHDEKAAFALADASGPKSPARCRIVARSVHSRTALPFLSRQVRWLGHQPRLSGVHLHASSFSRPLLCPQQGHGELANGRGDVQSAALHRHGVRPFNAQTYRLASLSLAGEGWRKAVFNEPPLPLTVFSRDLQVQAGIAVDVAHAASDGDVGVPLGRVSADEVGDVRVQPVEGRQAWVWKKASVTVWVSVSALRSRHWAWRP
jgi:hypothetical protein